LLLDHLSTPPYGCKEWWSNVNQGLHAIFTGINWLFLSESGRKCQFLI
jgi:hypothetical protein